MGFSPNRVKAASRQTNPNLPPVNRPEFKRMQDELERSVFTSPEVSREPNASRHISHHPSRDELQLHRMTYIVDGTDTVSEVYPYDSISNHE